MREMGVRSSQYRPSLIDIPASQGRATVSRFGPVVRRCQLSVFRTLRWYQLGVFSRGTVTLVVLPRCVSYGTVVVSTQCGSAACPFCQSHNCSAERRRTGSVTE